MLWKLLLPALLMSVGLRGTVGTDQRVARQAPDACSYDIVFVVDDSSSISISRFFLAKKFIIDFLQCFNDQDIGIGVILFNCAPRTGIPLGTYTISDPGLPANISQLIKKSGLSNIGKAIRFMKDTSNFRDGVPRAVILLTDGMAQDDVNAQAIDDYETQAETVRNAGIDLYAVGIGAPSFADYDVLETIAGSADRVFPSDNPCKVAYRILANLCAAAAGAGCLYSGVLIPVDEVYKPDDCTTCTCSAAEEDPVCAVQDCAPPPCSDPVKIAGQCCRVCDAPPGCLHDGAIIPVGGRYRTPNGCTWCDCYADGAQPICAAVGCALDPGCLNHVQIAGQCCPTCPACCQGCQHGDDAIPLGASFQPNPCTTCFCDAGGQVACAVIACDEPPCDNPVTLPGQCCPICPDVGCDNDDGINQVDDCISCTCSAAGQEPVCTTPSCPPPACERPIHVAGECCPVCESEIYGLMSTGGMGEWELQGCWVFLPKRPGERWSQAYFVIKGSPRKVNDCYICHCKFHGGTASCKLDASSVLSHCILKKEETVSLNFNG